LTGIDLGGDFTPEVSSGHTSVFYFGVDYYPEHWPEERWPEDARLMAEAGFNIVRLAEFAWSKLEPVDAAKPGDEQYDFNWLDRALAILHDRGIYAVLGTPTASPPPWLMLKNPDIFRVRNDGRRVTFGNRREYCQNHQLYHQRTRQIVTAMAEHYTNHPAVIGWQIDNEFGDRCFCPVCQAKFQEWLKERYGTLDALNARWGTNFWSHVYNQWDEIPVPVTTGGSPNPGLALDFARFTSDSYVAYQQIQVDILRDICSTHFVTHNFMGFGYEGLNYYDLARKLDIVTWDNYPVGFWLPDQPDACGPALGHDTIRGLKQQNFWVMEQQAGPSGWETISPSPRPGELRLWAYQAIAHGADSIVFFRWRTARHGTEQYWHGLLDHDARPGRRYAEIKRMGEEIKRIGVIVEGSTIRAKVAMLQSYDSRFGFQIQPNSPDFRYYLHFKAIYRALHQHQISVDVIEPTADLSPYKLVFVPSMYILPAEVVQNLDKFVRTGGTLVVTPRTGVKDEANAVVNLPLPGLLADMCGVTVEDYDALPPKSTQEVEFVIPELSASWPPQARIWCDILVPQSAEVIALYTRDYYAGQPAITRNVYGQGQVIYVGTFGDTPVYSTLLGWLLLDLGIQSTFTAPEGVEAAERWHKDQRILFILNHTAQSQVITLPRQYTNLLDQQPISGYVTMTPHDVLVLLEAE
jgi:beta-galactosidase